VVVVVVMKIDLRGLEQLDLGLDVEEVDVRGGGLSFEEVRARAMKARRALEDGDSWEQGEVPQWFEHYLQLRKKGRPWRVAVYVLWAASPKRGRWPATQLELATEVLGLTSDRQIYAWRKKYPEIDDMITMLQAAPLMEHRADIFEALVAVATDADYKAHSDRKLALEMLGDYVPRSKMDLGVAVGSDAVDDLSDEELRRRAGYMAGEVVEEGGATHEGTCSAPD